MRMGGGAAQVGCRLRWEYGETAASEQLLSKSQGRRGDGDYYYGFCLSFAFNDTSKHHPGNMKA